MKAFGERHDREIWKVEGLNIVVSLPDDVYRRARTWAAEGDTSISNVQRVFLDGLCTNPRAARLFSAEAAFSGPTTAEVHPPKNPNCP